MISMYWVLSPHTHIHTGDRVGWSHSIPQSVPRVTEERPLGDRRTGPDEGIRRLMSWVVGASKEMMCM